MNYHCIVIEVLQIKKPHCFFLHKSIMPSRHPWHCVKASKNAVIFSISVTFARISRNWIFFIGIQLVYIHIIHMYINIFYVSSMWVLAIYEESACPLRTHQRLFNTCRWMKRMHVQLYRSCSIESTSIFFFAIRSM